MRSPTVMPSKEALLPDRPEPVETDVLHFLTERALKGPFPSGHEEAIFGMGCFWGSEKLFWKVPGVWVTAVGYSGGKTANPTYKDVTSGRTGHAEVVRLIFDPKKTSYSQLLKWFWENHDPTAGMRQGDDTGIQYRSAIYYIGDEQHELAEATKEDYQKDLTQRGFGTITTEIKPARDFYFAEAYHQGYAAKNDDDCRVKGTGVICTIRSSAAGAKSKG